jgi:hypothetical protein
MIVRSRLSSLGFVLVACGVALSLAVFGCSRAPVGKPTGQVTGIVTLKGAPLPTGSITFQAADMALATGTIQDGEYIIPNAPVGPVSVFITAQSPTSEKQMQAMMKRRGASAEVQAEVSAAQSHEKAVPVPAKYRDPKTSGLKFEVVVGEQTKDFPLD